MSQQKIPCDILWYTLIQLGGLALIQDIHKSVMLKNEGLECISIFGCVQQTLAISTLVLKHWGLEPPKKSLTSIQCVFDFMVSHLTSRCCLHFVTSSSILVRMSHGASVMETTLELSHWKAWRLECSKLGFLRCYRYLVLEFWKAVWACTMCSFSGSTFHSTVFLFWQYLSFRCLPYL